jgi:hypothetical protein
VEGEVREVPVTPFSTVRNVVHAAALMMPLLSKMNRLSDDAPAKGLFVFIQPTICRWRVLEKVFTNEPSSKFCAYRE